MQCIEYVFRRTKKPIDIETVFKRVEERKRLEAALERQHAMFAEMDAQEAKAKERAFEEKKRSEEAMRRPKYSKKDEKSLF